LRELQRVARKRIIFNVRLGPDSHPYKRDREMIEALLNWPITRREEIVPGFWMYCCDKP
jgi:hypothetical protein